MKYSVNLRMKNPGPTKFLIESKDSEDLVGAFIVADEIIAKTPNMEKDYFVEIYDNVSKEKIASFNEEK